MLNDVMLSFAMLCVLAPLNWFFGKAGPRLRPGTKRVW
jgi:hypothetical protein